MGQILHGSAKTTHAVRALIQRSKASNAALSRELGINVKTVAKWRKRNYVADAQMGPKEVHSTVLSLEEEAVIVAFRRHTLLSQMACSLVFIPPLVRPIRRPRPPFSATMLFAVRCALRYVASIITVFSSPCSAASPTIIRAKMPFSLQRFQRL